MVIHILAVAMAALRAAQAASSRSKTEHEDELIPVVPTQTPVATAEPLEPEPTEAAADVIDFAAAKSHILAKRYLSRGVLE